MVIYPQANHLVVEALLPPGRGHDVVGEPGPVHLLRLPVVGSARPAGHPPRVEGLLREHALPQGLRLLPHGPELPLGAVEVPGGPAQAGPVGQVLNVGGRAEHVAVPRPVDVWVLG